MPLYHIVHVEYRNNGEYSLICPTRKTYLFTYYFKVSIAVSNFILKVQSYMIRKT